MFALTTRSQKLIATVLGLALTTSITFLYVLTRTSTPSSPFSFRLITSGTSAQSPPVQLQDSSYVPPYSSRTLGVASRIFVISLARRSDRHLQMLSLANIMHLNFTWVDAIDASDPVVFQIMERVRWERAVEAIREQWGFLPDSFNTSDPSFKHMSHSYTDHVIWADDALPSAFIADASVDATDWNLANSHTGPIELSGSDLWTVDPLADTRSAQYTNPIPPPPDPDLRLPLPCAPIPLAFPNDTDEIFQGQQFLPQATQSLHHPPPSPYPFHLTLSFGMIACWYSHARVLRRVAEGMDEVVIILEDDVDMEYDLHARLASVWGALPPDWDLVMLGHCWSPEETTFPALSRTNFGVTESSLHPSFAPKCTHAYAVTKSGASRIIRHLRSTAPLTGGAFAYGRALDQAFVRLIQGGRIRAFSIIPSLVVQTKDGPSDIMHGNGSTWRDMLMDSALRRGGT